MGMFLPLQIESIIKRMWKDFPIKRGALKESENVQEIKSGNR